MAKGQKGSILDWLQEKSQEDEQSRQQGKFFEAMIASFSGISLTDQQQVLFTAILQQYIDICKESELLGSFSWHEPQRGFDFVSDFRESIAFLSSSKWHLRFTVYQSIGTNMGCLI